MTTTAFAQQRYSRTAIWLHWLIGLAVIVNIGLAMLTEGLPRETHMAAMGVHKALGMLILALTVLRILWRITHKPPPLPAETAGWERLLAKVTHFAFYALLILLPLSGWVWMSAAGRPIDFFGLGNLPMITGADKALADVLHERHEVLGIAMLALVILHIAGALKHQFLDRNNFVGRMSLRG